jgi:uncharacterized protein (DUF433 family)
MKTKNSTFHLTGEHRIVLSTSSNLIGKGVYSFAEAFRITKVPVGRIARWTKGYDFIYRGEARHSPPIIGSFQEGIDKPVLEFLDLIEIRFLNAFRDHGVGWKAIRIAAQRARELIGRTHPFSTKIFKTDGKRIFADFVHETGDKVLLDLVKNQYEFKKVVSPYLYSGIEFNDLKEPMRWFPLAHKKSIVIDPLRNFGAPIVADYGIPTRILVQSYSSLKSIRSVAQWYEIEEIAVKDSIIFEKRLAA